MSSRCVLV